MSLNKEKYRTLSEEEKRLRREYHLVYQRGTWVFSWRTAEYGNYREVFGTNLDKAKKKALLWIELIESGKNPKLEEEAKKLSLDELFRQVIHKRQRNNAQSTTLRRYQSIADNFKHWCAKRKIDTVNQITAEHIEEYFGDASKGPIIPNTTRKGIRAVRKNGAAPGTLKLEKTFLKGVFTFAVERQYCAQNPVALAEVTIKDKLDDNLANRTFFEHEIPLLIAAANTLKTPRSFFGNCTLAEIIETLFLTGLRLNELIHLQWSDILWGRTEHGCISIEEKRYVETITIPLSHTAFPHFYLACQNKMTDDFLFDDGQLKALPMNHLPIKRKEVLKRLRVKDIKIDGNCMSISFDMHWRPKGKAGKVPLTRRQREIFDAILENDASSSGYVFKGRNGGKIQTSLLTLMNDAIKAAQIDIGGRKLSVHSTRHTFGFMLRSKGTPIETIKELMRHSKLKETMRYAKYDLEQGAEAIQILDNLNSFKSNKVREVSQAC